ncbi:MAG: TlpA disulfide reductase family protein [Bacteroidota bacterium]|nr:TlpA disulfide reductase family protein [Bacteroidota bacterium]
MRKISFLFLTSILSHAVTLGQVKNRGFEITGIISGYADRTVIYLDNLSGPLNVHMDSTLIIRNGFRFAGSISEDAMHVMLKIASANDYKFFWLENAPITLKAAKGNLSEAVITGSKTQDEDNQLDAAIKATGREMEQDTLFIRTHPNSVISASILSIYCSAWGKKLTTDLYMDLSEKNRYSAYGLKILEYIRLNRNLKTGDKYADFEQPDAEGKMTRLSGIHAKAILLEFWGSWSGPSREANRELVKIYSEFKDRGFEIFGVAADDHMEDWLKAIHRDSLTWKNVTDLRGDRNRAVLIYGVSHFPANFLIDRSGIIVAMDLGAEALRGKLEEMLK